MADIRINALPTTASASSSDDYIALDGTTNGTRKLNAYSPTFGGNLTVSGTGTHTFGTTNTVTIAAGKISTTGKVGIGTTAHANLQLTVVQPTANAAALWTESVNTLGQSQGVIINAGTNASDFGLVVRNAAQTDMFKVDGASNATLAGNLTVSGTGGITVNPNQNAQTFVKISNANAGASADSTFQLANNSSTTNWGMRSTGAAAYFALDAGSSYLWYNGTTSLVIGATDAAGIIKFNTGGLSERMRLNASGNLLIGTTTDSGNGKLQLATHTTSAGGIGFGTDVSLYRSGADQLTSNSSGTANNFFLRHSTTAAGGFQVQIDSSKDVYLFQRENRPMYIGTNNTTALTLDSSQNATFANGLVAGKTSSVNTITGGDAGGGTYIIQFKDGLGAAKVNITGDGKTILLNTTASTSTTTGALQVSGGVGVAGAVNVGGAIAIGNTVQTAVSVASTHKVTISIGGSTYYLLATNV